MTYVPMEYLFIDGGYLRARYVEMMKEFFGLAYVNHIDFDQIRRDCKAEKAFYYDSLDDVRKKDESEDDFQRRLKGQEDFFNGIRSQPGYHVVLGSISGSRPKGTRQKQVDVQLAVDMLNHAVRKNMQRASLLAGDLDFKPVIKALIEHGIYTQLRYVRKHTSKELLWSADHGVEITLKEMHNWTNKQVRSGLPQESFEDPIHGNAAIRGLDQLRVGQFNGEPVWLYGSPNSPSRAVVVQRVNDEVRMLTIAFHKEDALLKYFETMYGQIQW